MPHFLLGLKTIIYNCISSIDYYLFCLRITTLRDSTSMSKVAREAAKYGRLIHHLTLSFHHHLNNVIRSMMVFKKFMQSRGQYLISTEREFMNYRILHKVSNAIFFSVNPIKYS